MKYMPLMLISFQFSGPLHLSHVLLFNEHTRTSKETLGGSRLDFDQVQTGALMLSVKSLQGLTGFHLLKSS